MSALDLISSPNASLSTLPADLLICIAAELSTRDLRSLRGICRHVNSALLDTFRRESFHTITFYCTTSGVAAAKVIAQDPALAEWVNELRLVPCTDSSRTVGSRTETKVRKDEVVLLGLGVEPTSAAQCPPTGAVDSTADRQSDGDMDAPLTKHLAEIIAFLPNLEALSVSQGDLLLSGRANGPPSRYGRVDYPHKTPLGVAERGAAAMNQFDQSDRGEYDDFVSLSLVLGTILRSLIFAVGTAYRAHPGCKRIRSVKVTPEDYLFAGLDDAAFWLSPGEESLAAPVLGELETLGLYLEPVGYGKHTTHTNLESYLTRCRNLVALQIGAYTRDKHELKQTHATWPAGEAVIPVLPRLRKLQLSGHCLTPEFVLRLFTERHLCDVRLFSINLLETDAPCHISRDGHKMTWAWLLNSLSAHYVALGTPSPLATLELSSLRERHGSTNYTAAFEHDTSCCSESTASLLFVSQDSYARCWNFGRSVNTPVEDKAIEVEGEDIFLRAAHSLVEPKYHAPYDHWVMELED